MAPARKLARVAAVGALLLTAGCGDGFFGEAEDPPLPGERLPVIGLDDTLVPDPRIARLPVELPPPAANANWPQAGGLPSHAMHHLAAPGTLDLRWSADIGRGSGSDGQLLAQPVVAKGRVYTLDVDAEIRVFDLDDGSLLWHRELGDETREDGTLGGGLAVGEGRLYVTTGFAHVFALDAATGTELWRRRLPNPIRAAPTSRGGRVFVVTLSNELFALDAASGQVVWSHEEIAEPAGLAGAASPAVDGGIVVAPFSSGAIVALRAANGRVAWSDRLVALRRTDPVSSLAHVRGMPVIDRGLVIGVSNSGRTVAIDQRTGRRVWERRIGGTHTAWVAGEFVYLVSNDNRLACLSRRDGRVRWVRALPQYEDEEDRSGPISWSGPVLASDRLLIASSTGEVWSMSPYTGEPLGRVELPDPVFIAPAVAGETVFLLTEDAELLALR